MSVSLWVGSTSYDIGSASFFDAFFSTVHTWLEPGGAWGSRCPTLLNSLYQGKLPSKAMPAALDELGAIETAFSQRRDSDIVWDHLDPEAKPPWFNDLRGQRSLRDSWFTNNGKDLFAVMREAFERSKRVGKPVTIE